METDYRKRFYFTLVMVLLGGAAYFFRDEIMMVVSGQSKKTVSARIEEKPAKEKKIKYWTDPMIPGFQSPGPGKSPMGMDMIPVYEEDAIRDSGITISPGMVQNLGVRTQKAALRTISRSIRASGVVTYDERKVKNIQSKVTGWVEKLYVGYTGEAVKEGDYLLEIYSPDLVATEEEFLLAIKNRDIATKGPEKDIDMSGDEMYQAARKRLQYFDVPEHQIFDLEWKHQIMKTLHIHSSSTGVVVSKPIFAGMQVTPGMTLYTVADLSKVWVLADVYEYEIGWLKVGDTATLMLPSLPGKEFFGKIAYINPFLEKETRTVKVRMEFENPRFELKPEMFANVELHTGAQEKALTVPKEAVIRGGKHDFVVVQGGGGQFIPREVTIGKDADRYFEILSGLYEGEIVVTSAQFLIDSESNLRESLEKMTYEQPESSTGSHVMEHASHQIEENSRSEPNHSDHSTNLSHSHAEMRNMEQHNSSVNDEGSHHNHGNHKGKE